MQENQPEIIIREAVTEDAKKISVLIREAMEYYRMASGIKADVLESLTEGVDSVKERIRRHHCIIAECDREPIRTLSVNYCDNPMKYSFSTQTRRTFRSTGTAHISRVLRSRPNTGIQVSEYR